jgi:hypothetical protein
MGVVERVPPACATVSIHVNFAPIELLQCIHKDFSITGEYLTPRMTPTGFRADVAPDGRTRWGQAVAR